MRFWDSSAVVPLIVEEEASRACRDLLRADRRPLVWCLTRTELLSAIWRRHREGQLDAAAARVAERRVDGLGAAWSEVQTVTEVRDAAERLLRLHALRAADALQLGAAVVALGPRTRGKAFVVLDDQLALAAEREGFAVVVPQPA